MSSRWITIGLLVVAVIGQTAQGLSDELSTRNLKGTKGPTSPKAPKAPKAPKGSPSGIGAVPTTAPLAAPSSSPHTGESPLTTPTRAPVVAPVVVPKPTPTKTLKATKAPKAPKPAKGSLPTTPPTASPMASPSTDSPNGGSELTEPTAAPVQVAKPVSPTKPPKSSKATKPPTISKNTLCSKVLGEAAPGLNCKCSVNFLELSASYECSIDRYCILSKTMCGGSKLSGKYLVPDQSLTTQNCISLKSSNPTFPSSVCVSSDHCTGQPGTLCGCSAQIDGTACNSCTVCPSGRTVQLDCTNIYSWLSTPCIPLPL